MNEHIREYDKSEGVRGTYCITALPATNIFVRTNNIYQFLMEEIRNHNANVRYKDTDSNGNPDWIGLEEAEARQRLDMLGDKKCS